MKNGKWRMSEVAHEVPEVDMAAINAAIAEALGDTPDGASAAPAAAEEPKKEETPKKGKGLKLKDVGAPAAATPKEEKPKTPRAPAQKVPEQSVFGTPIIRAAHDNCAVCGKIVKWYSTTDGGGVAVWVCSVCGRVVPRKVKKAAAKTE